MTEQNGEVWSMFFPIFMKRWKLANICAHCKMDNFAVDLEKRTYQRCVLVTHTKLDPNQDGRIVIIVYTGIEKWLLIVRSQISRLHPIHFFADYSFLMFSQKISQRKIKLSLIFDRQTCTAPELWDKCEYPESDLFLVGH